MGHEESFIPPQEPEAQREFAHAGEQPVYDAAYYLDTFGLGPEETSASVTYKGHVGTIADMLKDRKECPVGDWMADAYREEGLAGVEEMGEFMRRRSKDTFQFAVSEKTRAYHAGTLSRDELLPKPVEARAPDFLARLAIDSQSQ